MEYQNKSSSYKWVILAVFSMISAINSILFISFAPLISFVQNKYGVSEFSASTLVMIFPLLNIIISFPCGVMADKLGYKSTMRLGCILIAAFACLRVYNGSFMILFIGQLGIAIGTPFVINTTVKVMGDWFKDKEIAFANGIASCGLFIGMALGMGLAPILVGFIGFQQLMALHAGIAIMGAIVVIVLIKEKCRNFMAEEEGGSWAVFIALIKNPNLRIIFILSFIAAGYFNGLTTWLEPMLSVKGISAKQAGLVGASLILGGIFGSLIMPAMSDKYGKRKPFIMFCCLAAALSTYPLCTGANFKVLLILGVSVGGFFFPGYPLMLSLLKEIAGAKRTGMAMGIFSIVGNSGGTIFIILMEVVKKASNTWLYSIYMLIAILVIALLITTRLKEPRID